MLLVLKVPRNVYSHERVRAMMAADMIAQAVSGAVVMPNDCTLEMMPAFDIAAARQQFIVAAAGKTDAVPELYDDEPPEVAATAATMKKGGLVIDIDGLSEADCAELGRLAELLRQAGANGYRARVRLVLEALPGN